MTRSWTIRAAAVFIGLAVGVAILNWWVGAPLYSPDSRAYLNTSRAPFHFGGWHPPLFPIAVWAFAKVGIGPFWVMTILGTTFTWLVYLLFERRGRGLLGIVAALALLASPTWIMLRAAFWTETLFLLLVAALGLVLSERRWPLLVRWAIAIPLWLLSIEARYAGLFLFPAVVLGLAFAPAGRHWRFSPARFVAAGVACLAAWAGVNLLKTGSPVRQGTSSLQCVSLATSFNALPYCTWLPQNAICQADPERRWVNRADQRAAFLTDLQFSADSPLQRLMEQQTEAGLCRATNEFLVFGAVRHPVAMASIVGRRLWPFLGPWETTEQWPGFDGRREGPAYRRLEGWLAAERSIQWLYQLVFVVAVAGLLWRGAWEPGIVFFLGGALAHMAGVAATNPFMVLRYMAVTKVMVAVAALLLVARVLSRKAPGA